MSTEAGIKLCDTLLHCMAMGYSRLTDDGILTKASDRYHGFSKKHKYINMTEHDRANVQYVIKRIIHKNTHSAFD